MPTIWTNLLKFSRPILVWKRLCRFCRPAAQVQGEWNRTEGGMQPVAKREGPAIWCAARYAEDKHKPDRMVQRPQLQERSRRGHAQLKKCKNTKNARNEYYASKFNGAPLNARRCRPRLAGAQGAHYANARELSCHTRGVLRGHYDTMPCPTGLPSGARRCWVPLA